MLSKEQQDIIIETLMPFNPTYIGLFGSYARNEEKINSDIDLLIDLNYPKLSLFDIGGLHWDLEQKLKTKIDLAFKNKIKEDFKPTILKDIIVIFKK
jgi:predicted nucleotidyltransferase